MDYFATFKRRIVPPKAQTTTAKQLVRFHKCWDFIQNALAAEEQKPIAHVDQTGIPEKLLQMVDLLVDEQARDDESTTGVCMEYLLKNNILHFLVSVVEKGDHPTGIRGQVVRTVASMVNLLDDRFLVHSAIHRPTVRLLQHCVVNEGQSELYHEHIVVLMYTICSKIYGFPALLQIFFRNNQETNKQEFLLFTYLLRYVHREGPWGDYVRTGLLFLIDMATDKLGDYILASDFAPIMAAALGALYAQLPRKLIIRDESLLDHAPVSLLCQDDDPALMFSNPDMESSGSSTFKSQLDSFLKLFEFVQELMERCPSPQICLSLLQNIRVLFLENILYPSILECSDTDGSTVAVVSYVDLVLQTVQHGELANVIVTFLMDDDNHEPCEFPDHEEHDEISNLFAGIELDQFKSSPYFMAAGRFTLKDLIFSRLKSSSQPTVIATLRLLKTLLTHHCQFALRLLSICPDMDNDFRRQAIPVSHHMREIELYLSLIPTTNDNADEAQLSGYEHYLHDIATLLTLDECYRHRYDTMSNSFYFDDGKVNLQRSQRPQPKRRRSFKYGSRYDNNSATQQVAETRTRQAVKRRFRHRIRPTDPLLQILLGLLSHFFGQAPELNLALTDVIVTLALCPYRSLKGWISFCDRDRSRPHDILVLDGNRFVPSSPHQKETHFTSDDPQDQFSDPAFDDDNDDDYDTEFGEDNDDEEDVIPKAGRRRTRLPSPTQFKSFPPFFTLFRTLTQQIDYYRSEIEDFDALLEQRRQVLQCQLPTPVPVASPLPTLPGTTWSTGMGYLFGYMRSASPDHSKTYPAQADDPLFSHIQITQQTKLKPLFPANFVTEAANTEISLSMLLNNVIIVEEAIKEIIALMQVRRSLGIDDIEYHH